MRLRGQRHTVALPCALSVKEFTQAGEAGLLKRTIASNATYSVPGNASEGVRSAGLVRRPHSSTVGDTSPRDAFPALSSWSAEVSLPPQTE